MAKTTIAQYYEKCFRRAVRGKFAKAEGITSLLALAALPFGYWLWPSESGAMNWVPLIFFLCLLFVSFVIALELAPYQMLREVEDENDSLKDRLDNRERRQAAMARLWQLRADGVELRNQHVRLGEYGAWSQSYYAWCDGVYAEARLVSPNLEAWLRTLDQVRPGRT
jgi:hypothetical protein